MSVEKPKFSQEEEEEMEGKAEDTMTELQKESSHRREESIKKLRELGVEGYLYYDEVANLEGSNALKGELNGSDVYIEKKENGEFSGNVDGKDVPASVAKKLWDKYADVAVNEGDERSDRSLIQYALEKQHRTRALRMAEKYDLSSEEVDQYREGIEVVEFKKLL